MGFLMSNSINADYYRRREVQALRASQMAGDPEIRRLHWKMARRYADLAAQASAVVGSRAKRAV